MTVFDTTFGRSQEFPPLFIGRQAQLDWLGRIFVSQKHWERPFVVTGPVGSGKTTFVRWFLATHHLRSQSIWLTASASADEALRELDGRLRSGVHRQPIIVFDEVAALSNEQIQHLWHGATNWKLVRAVFFISQRSLPFENAPTLTLTGFNDAETKEFLERALTYKLSQQQLQQAANIARGNPLAASVLLTLLATAGPDELDRLLSGRVYDLSESAAAPQVSKLLAPKIITANELLIEKLKQQPESIYSLSSRKFEEVLADLLSDLGYDVELTPATRDGGRDILAFYNTGAMRLLCLVEAKRYREDRKVGVGLVRELYGTLCSQDAASAMLVTTSSFSRDAKAFAQKHEWRLHLKDYGNLVKWIQEYQAQPRSAIDK